MVSKARVRSTAPKRSRQDRHAGAALLPLWFSDGDAVSFYAGVPIDRLPARVAWELIRVVRVWRGGPEANVAMEEILAVVRPKVYRAVTKAACPGWSIYDESQVVLAHIVRAIHRFHYRPGASLLSMLDRVIANKIIERVRNVERRINRLPEDLIVASDDPERTERLHEFGVHDHEIADAELAIDMGQLSERARRLADWVAVNGALSQRQARVDLGLSKDGYAKALAELRLWLLARCQ